MSGYKIAIIAALVAFAVEWTVALVLAQHDEDAALRWAMGPIYPLAYFLTYPIRQAHKYDSNRKRYEEAGITKWQYICGKKPDYSKIDYPNRWGER